MNSPDMFATISVDKFSFPSGHATRAVSIAAFFTYLYPLHFVVTPPLLVWSASVCASRVLLGRHHVLDVAGGIAIGLAETLLMGLIWMGEEKAVSLAQYFFGDDPWSNA